jgi:hypothetical protein
LTRQFIQMKWLKYKEKQENENPEKKRRGDLSAPGGIIRTRLVE